MFIEVGTNILNMDSLALVEIEKIDDESSAVIGWLNRRMFDSDENNIILFSGTSEQCRKYRDELKKELAAFGKLLRVEVD
jgi:hypothetical protein